MRVRKGVGFLGMGIASGAVLMVPAAIVIPAAIASAASANFNSTATARPGFVAVGGSAVTNRSSVTATDSSGPQGNTTGLPSGTSLPGGLGSVVPSGALTSTSAHASRSGTSDACSAIASGGCGAGAAQPLTVDLSLSRIVSVLGVSLPIGSLPMGLGQDQVVVALTGPGAACAAGPAGGPGSSFTATMTSASGTVGIKSGNGFLVGPVPIRGSDVLGSLSAGGALGMVLGALPANAVSLKYTPGSTAGAGAGPQSRAAAGELMLGVGGTSAVSLVGGSVSCGANQAAPGQTVTSSSPAAPPGGATTTGSGSLTGSGSSSSSSEHALSGIQSDEGRYVPASSDTPLWAGLAAGGAALAGGLALWRRRRHSRA